MTDIALSNLKLELYNNIYMHIKPTTKRIINVSSETRSNRTVISFLLFRCQPIHMSKYFFLNRQEFLTITYYSYFKI